jgi:hypothetical protein
MARFLKTVSATFAAGMICGAGALIAFAPSPVQNTSQPEKAEGSRVPVAITDPAAVPCKDQVWPNIDRRCMRWTAERWSAPAQRAASEAASSGSGGTEPAKPAPVKEPSQPAEAQTTPAQTTGSIAAAEGGTKPSHHAQAKKAARKSRVVRNRYNNEDRRVARAWGDENRGWGGESYVTDFFGARRTVSRPRQDSFFFRSY